MVKCIAVLVLSALAGLCANGPAASYARAIQEAGLDPDACYRVRDLAFQREDLRFYFNEGHLIFSKAVEGKRFSAVFTSDVPGGDAEVILFPPHRSERLSLATFTKSPNLNEHFAVAVFIFSDNTGSELLEQLERNAAKRVPEIGTAVAAQFREAVKNIADSYMIRLVQDRFSPIQGGFFYAALSGRRLGNFDVLFDPRRPDSVLVGQIANRDGVQYFDNWASFPSRSFRSGHRRSPASDIKNENIRIEATLGQGLAVQATTKMNFVATTAGDSAIAFDLSKRMQITEATLDGESVEVFARESLRANLGRGGNDLVLIVLKSPLEEGRKYTLEIKHQGDVISAAGSGVYFVGARTSWYPNRNAEFANYELVFHHPKNLDLVATGELVEESVEGEVRTAVHRTSAPIRFAGLNLGEYRKVQSERAGIRIAVCANRRVEEALNPRPREVLVMPQGGTSMAQRRMPRRADIVSVPLMAPLPNPSARLEELNAEVGSALEFMAGHFGPPPLKTLAVSPIPGIFGQGFPGLLYLSTLAYLDPAQRPEGWQSDRSRMFFSELLHSHETAHQWWGNLVTSASYRDDWLMEALANYSAMMVLEKRKGRRALDAVLDEYSNNILPVDSAGPIVWGTRLISSQSPGAWRVITYEKGSWIMHMLRSRLGDDAFLKMLGELARSKRFQPVSTEEFRTLAAGFLPKGADDPKLEIFFDQWVYGTGIPSLKLQYTVQGKAPALKLRGKVTQSDAGEEFTALVPVEVQLPGRRTVTEWVRTSSETTEFEIALKAQPLKVTLAPGNALLTRK